MTRSLVGSENIVSLTPPEPGMTPLRKAAEAAEEASGLRAEIIRGVLMMSPTRRGRHAGIVKALYDQVRPELADHLAPYQVASVSMPGDKDDYATPDLLVCDAGFGESDAWLADPGDVELVCEVVSKSNSSKGTRDMVSWYADAGVPTYLIVDPRDGTWTLYTVPREGAYQGVLHGLYGEDIELAALGLKITTGGFTRYSWYATRIRIYGSAPPPLVRGRRGVGRQGLRGARGCGCRAGPCPGGGCGR
ncbi:Uma2 family endonuclease [Streptomyces coffeae]|uniref:Uma2 family endonuclease n=1 Tax=Streptomyces coffeae TaxID=621382 RepID=A0ABS1NRC2_9ACTN|nr:Uma2 family endonuclease [Streptomyces coffeae]MBL1102427.1 Uma2 family endonuclease [Streptomyces coffeae]